MMQNYKNVFVVALWLLLCPLSMWAQPEIERIEGVKKKFPDAKTVLLDEEHYIEYYFKGSELKLKSAAIIRYLYVDNTGVVAGERQIPYKNGQYEISKLEATAYEWTGVKYKKEKINNFQDIESVDDDIFYHDTRYKKITFPGLQKNGVIEYSYTYDVIDLTTGNNFWLNDNVPTSNVKVIVTYPTGVDIGYKCFGDTSFMQKKTEVSGSKTTVTWWANDVKATHSYRDINSFRENATSLHVFLKGYKQKNIYFTHLANEKGLYDFFRKYTDTLNNDAPIPEIVQVVDSIRKTSSSEKEIVKNVYYWVKDHVKYIAFEDGEGGQRPREANDIFRKKYGDCKDYSSLITFMLKQANIKAYLCWIGTTDLPYSFKDLPSPYACNHMIAAIKLDGEWVFLDGTSRSAAFGYPSGFIQGKEAMIGLSPDSFLVKKVPVVDAEKNKRIRTFKLKIDDKNILRADVVGTIKGYPRFQFTDRVQNYDAKNRDEFIKAMLFWGSNKAKVEFYSLNNLDTRDSMLTVNYKLSIENYVSKIEDELNINLFLTKFIDDDFKVDTAENRKVSKAFLHAVSDEQICELEVPTGYQINYLPPNFSYNDEHLSIDISYKVAGNKVTMHEKYTHRLMEVKSTYFDTWNKQMSKVIDAHRELVVLGKKKK